MYGSLFSITMNITKSDPKLLITDTIHKFSTLYGFQYAGDVDHSEHLLDNVKVSKYVNKTGEVVYLLVYITTDDVSTSIYVDDLIYSYDNDRAHLGFMGRGYNILPCRIAKINTV
jgi:hypothetical protein